MNTPMNLKEFTERMDSTEDIMELVQDERVKAFSKSIIDAGADILMPLDEKYLAGAVAIVQAGVLSELIAQAEDTQEILQILGLSHSTLFKAIVVFAMKYSIGVATVEELR